VLALLALTSMRFDVAVSEFANTVYHVSCLTGRIQCTNAVFTEFWQNRYAVTRLPHSYRTTQATIRHSVYRPGTSNRLFFQVAR
jgi:hypothetical protein